MFFITDEFIQINKKNYEKWELAVLVLEKLWNQIL